MYEIYQSFGGSATTLPIDVHEICRRLNVKVLYDDKAKNWEGVATVFKGRPIVVLKAGLSPERERYVLAHEIGHLMLGHVGAWETVADRPKLPHCVQEREAIAYGMELIMLQAVLCTADVDEIQQRCGVSRATAVYRHSQFCKQRKEN